MTDTPANPITRIVRSKRKTLAVQITPEGEVVIKAPRLASDAVILEMVGRKREWIQEKLSQVERRRTQVLSFELPPHKIATLEKRALGVLTEIVDEWGARMSLTPASIKTTKARTLWGSCTGKDVVRLNWRLLLVPAQCREYVVIHELAHIAHKNHSGEFWSLVEEYCPDYKETRDKLREYEGLLRQY